MAPKPFLLWGVFVFGTLTALGADPAVDPLEPLEPLDVIPGYFQFRHDDPLLGSLTLGGTVASWAGLLAAVWGDASPGEFCVVKDGQHYVHWSEPGTRTSTSRWASAAGFSTSLWGSFFSAYGTWDMYLKTRASPGLRGQTALSMGDYLTAPFDPNQVFNSDVFPVLPLLTLGNLGMSDYRKIGAFFSRPSVDFVGMRVSPGAGLALTASASVLVVAANATLEEILFRGMLLDRYGVAGSSVIFGANHLLNAAVLPNFSVEDALQQSVFATLFGWYAADRTVAHGGDFRRMIALHFWNNVTAFVVGYLVDPESPLLFQITIPLKL